MRGGWSHFLREVMQEALFQEVRSEIELLKVSDPCRHKGRALHYRVSRAERAQSPGERSEGQCG